MLKKSSYNNIRINTHKKEINQYELIEICKATAKHKNKLVNGKWTKSDEKDIYIDYEIV